MQTGHGHQVSSDGRYFERYDPEEWRSLLEESGFRIEMHDEDVVERAMADGALRRIAWLVTLCSSV
jgi:hypothetical protein